MLDSPAPHTATPRVRLRYLPGIDGLRALSVLAVLAFHHYDISQARSALPGGFLGVEVFFVISGYLITSLLLEERRGTGTVSLKNFWLRRARRLLPALFVMLAVVTAWALLFMPDAIGTLRGDVLAALTYTSNWWQLAADRSYFSQDDPELLKHLWSLAIEEQFYLFWPPLLMLGLRKLGRTKMLMTLLGVALFSTFLMAFQAHPKLGWDPSSVYYPTTHRLSGLLLGSALAFVWTPRRFRGRTGPGARVVLDAAGAIGLVCLWWSFRHFHFDTPSLYEKGGFLFVDIATVLIIAAVVHPRADWNFLLGIRPLQWIGLRSYGIYLWHYPLFWITTKARIENAFGFQPPNAFWLTLRFLLTLLLAELSFRFVETPIRSGAISRYVAGLRESRGVRRRRMATRGIVIVASVSLLAGLLGSNLANASPEEEKIHGIEDQAREENEDPDAPRDDAFAQARAAFASTTTTTATSTTTTTIVPVPVDPTATTVAPPETTVPPTTAPPPPPPALAIGDSVMLGAADELRAAMPGMVVDAVVSRQFAHAIAVIQAYKDGGLLPSVVVVHLGTNGRFGDGEFDHMMATIGPDRLAFFLTAREPRLWEAEVNDTLTHGVQRYPNARLIDWRQFSGCNSDWFARDGFHVTGTGATNYAGFVRAHITNQAATLVYCP